MRNFIQAGKTLTVTAPAGGVLSGQLLVTGALIGVCATTQAAGEEVEVDVEGVFELPKLAADVVATGDRLYWDSGQSKLTKTPGTGSKPLVGYATAPAGNGAAVVRCRVTPTLATGAA